MKSPPIMYAYAAFLVVLGLVAFAMAGFEMRAITALVAPAGAAVIMVACGVAASKVHTNHSAGMTGIHVGLVLPLLLAALFGMLGFRRLTAEDPVVYLGTIFVILAVGSIITFVLILLTRPKPEART